MKSSRTAIQCGESSVGGELSASGGMYASAVSSTASDRRSGSRATAAQKAALTSSANFSNIVPWKAAQDLQTRERRQDAQFSSLQRPERHAASKEHNPSTNVDCRVQSAGAAHSVVMGRLGYANTCQRGMSVARIQDAGSTLGSTCADSARFQPESGVSAGLLGSRLRDPGSATLGHATATASQLCTEFEHCRGLF